MISAPPILSLKNVSYAVGEFPILKNVSFDIHEGSLTGLIGPNGSGKTTLFNCISGFSPISAGKIFFEGIDCTYLQADKRALKGLGRVFQNFGIFRDQTVLENMLVAFESKDSFLQSLIPNKQRLNRYKIQSMDLLKKVSLDSKADNKAGSLSGGQMRLLEIIRTLAFGAKIFLLDEPTAGVSPRMKDDIINIIQQLKTLGKTIFIIEHDMNFIQSFVERIIVMDSGSIFMDDTPEKVMSDSRLQDLYFGKRGN